MKLSTIYRLRIKDENRWLTINSKLIKENKKFDVNGVSKYLYDISIKNEIEVYSLLATIIAYRLKNKYQSKKKNCNSSVTQYIIKLKSLITDKSLYDYMINNFDNIYNHIIKKASVGMNVPIEKFPIKCKWSISELLIYKDLLKNSK